MLSKHHERKVPKNLGHIQSLARSHTRTAIKVLAGIMNEKTCQPMARIVAAKALLDRGWGKCAETHHVDVNDGGTLLKVVNEIVHVHETREQIEFNDPNPTVRGQPDQKRRQYSLTAFSRFRTAPIFQPLLAPARYKGCGSTKA